jgi:transposase
VVSNSRVGLTDIPGIGFEGKSAFYDVLRRLHP